MLEVKRKPNDSQSTRNGSALAAVRPYQEVRSEMRPNPVPNNAATQPIDRSETVVPVLVPVPQENKHYQTKTPVITGEAHCKGTLSLDGVLVGQLSANGGSLTARQKTSSFFTFQPELSGEISFRDMLRVNGNIAGTVYSKTGTLIIDNSATVKANLDVAVAIVNGTVHGDIVARERVEVGPSAKIYGNIWTRSLAIKDGAIFDGVCTMIEEKSN